MSGGLAAFFIFVDGDEEWGGRRKQRRQPRLERVVETETHQARSQVRERETERQKRKCFYVKILCVYTYARDLDAVEMTLIYIL